MIENEHVRRDFQATLDHQPGVGAAKIISKWFFQPPDIFDPTPRKRIKSGVVLCLIYLTLIAAVCAAFNLR
jgi:hypothetical protein